MKGFTFSTSCGNTYVYNDLNGLIFPAYQTRDYGILPDTRDTVKAEVPEVKRYLLEQGFRELILETTQRCNLRCRYCYFGDHYPQMRAHGSDSMQFYTARKAIDYYMESHKRLLHRNPFRKAAITFSGGEPLINYGLIREVVDYCSQAYGELEIQYILITNGVLLFTDILDYLVSHHFSILISLDGEEANHDRNRVHKDGSGSFSQTFQAVQRIKKSYGEYENWGVAICMDYQTDLFALENFVKENHLFVAQISSVSPRETDFYDTFTAEDKHRFCQQLKQLQKRYFHKVKTGTLSPEEDGLLLSLFFPDYMQFASRCVMENKRPSFLPYTGSSIPGEKLFVTIDGIYHMCENISPDFSVGNVDHGLDYESITDYVNCLNRFSFQCRKCRVSRLCGLGFSQTTTQAQVQTPVAYCDRRAKEVREFLISYTECEENHPGAVDGLTKEYDTRMCKVRGPAAHMVI